MKFKILIIALSLTFCGVDSSVNESTTTTKVVTSSFKPKVNNPDKLINNLFYVLTDEIDKEIEKWEEINNPDCENSSLQSCGVIDIFAETALKNAKRNSLLISILKANMSFIEFYYYYLEEVNNCEEVLNWYISEGGISYNIGNLNLIEASVELDTKIVNGYKIVSEK